MSRGFGEQYWKTCALILAFLSSASHHSFAQEISPDLYSRLEFRHIGPPGNRVAAVAGVPGDAKIYYAGAASGGIWKSTDGGGLWEPIFDDYPVQSIGALAVAPSNPDIVWAGTGESWIRSNISIGNGVYKSTDGGETWKHMGLTETGRIPRIVIHPRDPDTVWSPPWAIVTARNRNAVFFAPPMEGGLGTRCSSSMRTRAFPIW